MSTYYEVKFPAESITVPAQGVSHAQAVQIITDAVIEYVKSHTELIEPKIEVPENVTATFVTADVSQQVEETG